MKLKINLSKLVSVLEVDPLFVLKLFNWSMVFVQEERERDGK